MPRFFSAVCLVIFIWGGCSQRCENILRCNHLFSLKLLPSLQRSLLFVPVRVGYFSKAKVSDYLRLES